MASRRLTGVAGGEAGRDAHGQDPVSPDLVDAESAVSQ
jgi:hypothetical protein